MLERNIEKLLFACRWLLAPMYLGLAFALLALTVKFFQEVAHSLAGIFTLAESDLVLSVLSLIDIVLVGSLIVMVMLSGYENFVSKLDADAAQESPAWLGKLDSGTLKLKVAASIVAISSIHLLRIFMNAQATPNDKILWYVVLHLTFVVSAVLLGVLDRIAFSAHRDSGAGQFPRLSARNSHAATPHCIVQLHLRSASHIAVTSLTASRPASIHNHVCWL